MLKDVGTFGVTSGNLIVSDPCFQKELEQSLVLPVSNGVWAAKVRLTDFVVDALIVTKVGVDFNAETAIAEAGTVKVESGQVGIFDEPYYRNDKTLNDGVEIINSGFYTSGDLFFELCCRRTSAEDSYGIFPFGVVSTSGYGDGEFVVSVLSQNNEIVGIKVIFVKVVDLADYSDEMYDDETDEEYLEKLENDFKEFLDENEE